MVRSKNGTQILYFLIPKHVLIFTALHCFFFCYIFIRIPIKCCRYISVRTSGTSIVYRKDWFIGKGPRFFQFIKYCTKGKNVENFLFICEDIQLLYKDMAQIHWKIGWDVVLFGFFTWRFMGNHRNRAFSLRLLPQLLGNRIATLPFRSIDIIIQVQINGFEKWFFNECSFLMMDSSLLKMAFPQWLLCKYLW